MSSTTENFSTSTHLDRKALKRPDSFMTTVSGFFGELTQNTKGLMALGVALLVAGAGFSWWSSHQAKRVKQATDALYLADQALEKEISKRDAVTSTGSQKAAGAEKSDAKLTASYEKLDVDTQFPQGVAQLKSVSDQFPGTRPAFEALLELGTLYYNHGQTEKALPIFQKAASGAPEKLDRAFAWSAIAFTQENLGKFSEALAAYQQAISVGEATLKGDLLLGIARCYEGIHDSAKARSVYEQVAKEFPGGDYAKTAERLKSQL